MVRTNPSSETTAPVATTAGERSLEGHDAMPTDGAGEAAAAGAAIRELDALSASGLSAEQREALKEDQRLIAYLVRAELDGQWHSSKSAR